MSYLKKKSVLVNWEKRLESKNSIPLFITTGSAYFALCISKLSVLYAIEMVETLPLCPHSYAYLLLNLLTCLAVHCGSSLSSTVCVSTLSFSTQ